MFLQQLNTLATLYLTKWINTGDKILDSSLVAVFVVIVSTFLFHVVERWKDYYNFVVFYLYGMYKDPLAVRGVPYIMESSFEDNTEFLDKTRNSMTMVHTGTINHKLKGYKIKLTDTDVINIIIRYAESNNISRVFDKQCRRLSCYLDSDTYPIAVGRYGNIVYFETKYFEMRSRGRMGDRDTEYIKKYLINYIVESAIKDKPSVTNEDIYVPSFGRKEPNREMGAGVEMKSIGKINKKKTFDTLYYPQKNELIALLSRFQSGTMYPPHIPMDNKLGILLYGLPGTGKTGTISAVATMLRRSIVVINFANITTCKQLDEIMDPTHHAKFIYVFDEFDCVLDVIGGAVCSSDVGKKETKEKMDWGSALLFADEAERKNILAMMKEGRARKDDTPIDMAYLLQKLDGLESAEGRVIIATTNNPDKINPALLRPGRFDIKICLGPATETMVVDILTNFFLGDDALRSLVTAAHLPGGVFTPLELINAAIQTPDCEKLLAKLVDSCKNIH